MRQEHVFRFAKPDGLQVLELPYRGLHLSMIVLLPDAGDGLVGVEKRLTPANLAKWTAALAPRTVDVRFPRFAAESRLSLKPALSAMGMSSAFNLDRADFTGMTPKRPLFIEAVEHAALVEVNEEGTVAAAATSVSFGCAASAPPPPAEFHADHPFVFLIRDNHTGSVLFLGRIVNPTRR